MARQEGQQVDTMPVQQYGWDGKRPAKIPSAPLHDEIVMDETDPNNVVLTYKLAGDVVGTKTIVTTGTVTTITMEAV